MKVRLTWRLLGQTEPTEEVVEANSTCEAVMGLTDRCEEGAQVVSCKAEAVDATDA